VTLTFWLARPALIELLVRQEAPVCRVWETLTRRGERGLNRVRFVGRIDGKRLPPGRYRIRAEAIRDGKHNPLGAVTVVIAPRSQEIVRARAERSTCESRISGVTDQEVAAANALLRTGTDTADDDLEVAAETTKERLRVAAGDDAPRDPDDASVAGSIPNPFREASGWLQPFVIGMLALAVILLQLVALPARMIPSTGAALFVSQHRPEFLAAGAAMIVVVGVAVLLAL
jgi:hypothetical protein